MNFIFFHVYKVVAIVLLLVALGALYYQRKGALTLRWWGTPLFLFFLLLSFPVSVITFSYIVLVAIPADVQLAPWVTNLWRDWGWVYAFAWMAGLWLVIRCGGAQFSNTDARKLVLRRLTLLVLPLTLFDAACFLLMQKTSTPHVLAEAISPDGKLRIIAMRWDWLPSSSCEILVLQNKPYAFTATRLCNRGVYAVDPDFELARSVVQWSKDSRAVIFGTSETPIFAHDFSKQRTFLLDTDLSNFPSWDVGITVCRAEFRTVVRQLMDQHGGHTDVTIR